MDVDTLVLLLEVLIEVEALVDVELVLVVNDSVVDVELDVEDIEVLVL